VAWQTKGKCSVYRVASCTVCTMLRRRGVAWRKEKVRPGLFSHKWSKTHHGSDTKQHNHGKIGVGNQFKMANLFGRWKCGLELAKALQKTTTYNDGKMGDRDARTILKKALALVPGAACMT
jgi:hypothetical protein